MSHTRTGKDAFHRVPILSVSPSRDAVERVLTNHGLE
jgi:hypothetical protein